MWLINKCCLCIDLKVASLILASLGAFSHLYNMALLMDMPTAHHGAMRDRDLAVNEVAYNLMALYSFVAGIFCLVAIRGVLKSEPKQLRYFALINWFELGCSFAMTIIFSLMAFSLDVDDTCERIIDQRPDVDMDMKQCKQVYASLATWVTFVIAASLLLKLHFCLAVQSYYVRLLTQSQYDRIVDSAPYGDTIITSAPPPLYYETVPAAEAQSGKTIPSKF